MKSITLSILLLILTTATVSARSSGMFGRSGIEGTTCNACHSGGSAPDVMMDGKTELLPNETAVYTLTITSNSTRQTAAGFNVAVGDVNGVTAGQFGAGSDEIVNSAADEITHFGRKMADAAGVVTFVFSYTAPSVGGDYTMYYAGNGVNGANQQFGDRATADELSIRVVGNTVPTQIKLNHQSITVNLWNVVGLATLVLLVVVVLGAVTTVTMVVRSTAEDNVVQ